ncbi:winged helix-turn-helix domain-containing protein [Streptomyces sp. 1222.5]
MLIARTPRLAAAVWRLLHRHGWSRQCPALEFPSATTRRWACV